MELVAIADYVRSGNRPKLAAVHPDTPPTIKALIERCWAQDPRARPTAFTIAREMEAWLLVEVCWEES